MESLTALNNPIPSLDEPVYIFQTSMEAFLTRTAAAAARMAKRTSNESMWKKSTGKGDFCIKVVFAVARLHGFMIYNCIFFHFDSSSSTCYCLL
mmetsp:Transcript_15544/g.23702  ORF Transcript_15544/g.23702 Transcript_15544/m.23702 type:complete len:94 (+) Transcript_15544:998-1279(+)